MQNVAYVLNRYIGPFFAGFFLAAFASASDGVSAVIILALAGIFGFVSLPRNAEVIGRLFDGLGA